MHLISHRPEISVQRRRKMHARQLKKNAFLCANSGRLNPVDFKLVFILSTIIEREFFNEFSLAFETGQQRYFVLPEIYNVFNWRRASNIFRFTFLFLFIVPIMFFCFISSETENLYSQSMFHFHGSI